MVLLVVMVGVDDGWWHEQEEEEEEWPKTKKRGGGGREGEAVVFRVAQGHVHSLKPRASAPQQLSSHRVRQCRAW